MMVLELILALVTVANSDSVGQNCTGQTPDDSGAM
jgi:hypothetical protein